jgi:hypothetical protein
LPLVPLVEYADASPDVRAVYDDIMATRDTDRTKGFCLPDVSGLANATRRLADGYRGPVDERFFGGASK